jgi:hypothetical protein
MMAAFPNVASRAHRKYPREPAKSTKDVIVDINDGTNGAANIHSSFLIQSLNPE